jgi:exoribonuclease II
MNMGHIQKRKKFQKRQLATWRFNHAMTDITKSIRQAFIRYVESRLNHWQSWAIKSTFPAPASETGVESYDTAQKFSDCEHGA